MDDAMKKFMADLDALDFGDMGDDTFQGKTVNIIQWNVYLRIVRALAALPDNCKGVLSLDYLKKPNPAERDATVTLELAQISMIDGEVKTAVAAAVLICDRVSFSAIGGKVRISFAVDHIWMD